MAARYGAETTVLDGREGLVCSRCSGRPRDGMVVAKSRFRAEGEGGNGSVAVSFGLS
jgi:hypothetical protein